MPSSTSTPVRCLVDRQGSCQRSSAVFAPPWTRVVSRGVVVELGGRPSCHPEEVAPPGARHMGQVGGPSTTVTSAKTSKP